MKFWLDRFWAILMGNNNKLHENDVREGLGTKPNHLVLVYNLANFDGCRA